MATIAEATQSLNDARQLVQQKRQEVAEVEQKLKETESRVPQANQTRLRSGIYSGLQGRERLQQTQSFLAGLRGKEGEVRDFSQELDRYETEQLAPVQREIQQAQLQQSAVDVLNEEIAETIDKYEGNFTSASSINRVRQAFAEAGLNPDEAQQAYTQAVTTPEGRYSLRTADGQFLGTVSTEGKVRAGQGFTFAGLKDGSYSFQQNVPAIPQPSVAEPSILGTKIPFKERVKTAFREAETYPQLVSTIFPSVPTTIRNVYEGSILQKGISGVKNLRDSRIKQQLRDAGLPDTPEYVAEYKRYANPFTNPDLSIEKVTGIRDFAGYRVGELNTATFLTLGALSTPNAIAVTKATAPEFRFTGTLERQGAGTRVNVIGATTERGYKPVFTVGSSIIKDAPRAPALTAGYTFNAERFFKLPRTTPTVRFSNIEPFISGSTARNLGEASLVTRRNIPLETGGFLRTTQRFPIGEGALIRTDTARLAKVRSELRVTGRDRDVFGLVSKQGGTPENPIFSFTGGTNVKMRINRRTGAISYVTKGKPNIFGRLYEIKPAEEGVKFLQPANIRKTPLSTTFGEQRQLPTTFKSDFNKVVGSVKSAGQRAIAKQKGSKSGISPIRYAGASSILAGNNGRVYSGFSGGASDFSNILGSAFRDSRSKTLASFEPQIQAQEDLFATPKIENFKSGARLFLTGIPQLSVRTRQAQILRQPQAEIMGIRQLARNLLAVIPRETAIVRVRQTQQPRQLLRQRQFLRTRTAQQQRQTGRTQRIPLPRVRTFLPKPTRAGRAQANPFDVFNVLGRRRGQDVLVARARTQRQAERELRDFLTQTLGASGKITRGGKPVRVNLGTGFRPAKREPTRVVQRRGFRLSTKAEVSEIMGAKRGRTRFL